MRGRSMSFIVTHPATNADLLDAMLGLLTPIDVLHDDVLLEIFDFYVRISTGIWGVEAWQSLVHVCRRWRCLVFGSPRRLNLRLVCTLRTPARECLDVWPALPLIVDGTISSTSVDNILVALGHRDRVCQIYLRQITPGLEWDKVLAAMQLPFPALTFLLLDVRYGEPALVIPDTFLGGSAPRLRSFTLYTIPVPGLPTLLLSTTHLTELDFFGIPHSMYISPEAMATCLSTLFSLRTLTLKFLSSRSRPDSDGEIRRPPPMPRSVLPSLDRFCFKGASEYLEDLVARIDAFRLDFLFITFFPQMNFDTPHLVQFISRTPRFQEPNEAHVSLNVDAQVRLLWASDDYGRLSMEICCEDSESQPSSIAQVCTMCLPPLPTVEILRLGVFNESLDSELEWRDDVENGQWLELLRPFTAAKSLYLSEEFQTDIASALQELVGGRTTEVLPFLQNIFLAGFEPSGAFQEAVAQFIAARRLSGHDPIAVLPL